ncbi:MAG: carbohydrate ABC transporter permease [Coprococcus phoceensis]
MFTYWNFIFSSFLAYGLTRFKAKGSGIIFLVVLGGMALSEQVALVPLYKMLKAVHLYNTYWAVILPYIAFRIPFTVFLMRSYFISIPKELEEAAVVDGYNSFQILQNYCANQQAYFCFLRNCLSEPCME